MPKNRTLAIEIDNEFKAISLEDGEWLAINRGDTIEKEVESEDEQGVFTYVYRFNPPNYKASSLVVEYSDGGVCFVGTLADAHVYSIADLN